MADYTVSAGVTTAVNTVTATEAGTINFTKFYPAFRIKNDTAGVLYISNKSVDSTNTTDEDVVSIEVSETLPLQYLKSQKKLYFYAVGAGQIRITVATSMQAFR